MPTTQPLSRSDLEALRRDLADHCCAAEENDNFKLATDLGRALDVIEAAIATATDDVPPVRGFGE
jgi:hypothetical protein